MWFQSLSKDKCDSWLNVMYLLITLSYKKRRLVNMLAVLNTKSGLLLQESRKTWSISEMNTEYEKLKHCWYIKADEC